MDSTTEKRGFFNWLTRFRKRSQGRRDGRSPTVSEPIEEPLRAGLAEMEVPLDPKPEGRLVAPLPDPKPHPASTEQPARKEEQKPVPAKTEPEQQAKLARSVERPNQLSAEDPKSVANYAAPPPTPDPKIGQNGIADHTAPNATHGALKTAEAKPQPDGVSPQHTHPAQSTGKQPQHNVGTPQVPDDKKVDYSGSEMQKPNSLTGAGKAGTAGPQMTGGQPGKITTDATKTATANPTLTEKQGVALKSTRDSNEQSLKSQSRLNVSLKRKDEEKFGKGALQLKSAGFDDKGGRNPSTMKLKQGAGTGDSSSTKTETSTQVPKNEGQGKNVETRKRELRTDKCLEKEEKLRDVTQKYNEAMKKDAVRKQLPPKKPTDIPPKPRGRGR